MKQYAMFGDALALSAELMARWIERFAAAARLQCPARNSRTPRPMRRRIKVRKVTPSA